MESSVQKPYAADDDEHQLALDPVTFEVIRNALRNTTEEMAITVRRAAYSTNIKTRADFSCAFFDTKLRSVAQSFAQPAHLVSMYTIVPLTVREVGAAEMKAGDTYLVNDPHRGSSHLNDIAVISPVDVDGHRVGYVANMAHHVDVGGSAPASLGVSRELMQEGIILPPTRVARDGEIDANVLNLILANLRGPRETGGDLRAQMSANVVGARRMASLVRQHSRQTLESFYDELIAYTDRWTDREIRKLPQGVFEAEGFRDDDGISDEPVHLRAKVIIADGHVRLDVGGSAAQRRAPLNCTRSMTLSTVAFTTRCLVDDRIPVNDGFLNHVHVDGPDELICTARPPAGVVGGWELCMLLTDLIFKALHPALPGRIPAASKGLVVNLGFGGHDPHRDEYYVYMETIAGGYGARPDKDGQDASQTHIQNTENAPIEEVELNYPILISRYELIEDSAGAGRFRGGAGVRRDFTFPYAAASCTILSDGRKFPPWGLEGGLEGRAAHFIFDPDGENKDLPSKHTFDMPRGCTLRVETPGGGGFGDPQARDPGAIERDIRDGKVSEAWARSCSNGGT